MVNQIMSIRVEQNDHILVSNGTRPMRDVTVFATTAAEAVGVDRSSFLMGSMLYVIREGLAYMLDSDGTAGEWRSVEDGSPLTGGES